MKVKVIISTGQTGFRSVGNEYELPNAVAKVYIEKGYVEAVKAPAKPKPKAKKAKK